MRTLVSISNNARLYRRSSPSQLIPLTIHKPNRKHYSTLPIISPQTDGVKVNVRVGSKSHQKQHNYDPLTTLSLSAHATTVHIAYRLSQQTPFPRPIHDILAAYDWVRKHLVSSVPQTNSHGSSHHHKSVGVIGELAGGSLAASLALTECHSHKPGAIKAAALGNAVVDWSSLFHNNNNTSDTQSESLNRELLALRSRAFLRPADRYDPFASPLLFFRTPAWELVPEPVLYGFPPSPCASVSASSPTATTSPSSPTASSSETKGQEEELFQKRRSHRKYPPLASNLRLPRTRIEVGRESGGVLREQGMEMAELMQRSVDGMARDDGYLPELNVASGGGGGGGGRKRVEVVEREGMLWGEKEMVEVGAWIGDALRSR
ncbi:MAG: hypothetical protein LQ350_001887 [Teloschistes chrysophthalmus]|nr:MAG: hypothetical protein LQ350_001887 [Niorma chrysophthalma]